MCVSSFIVFFLPLLFLAAGIRCPKNHYQAGSICVECGHAMKWCIACTGMGACTECAAGSYLSSGFCKPCDPICERCSGPGSCTSCIKSYCRTPNGTCEQPGKAHTNCNHCAHNTNNCESCDEGYFYSGSSLEPCKKCAQGCKTCKSANECTVASSGYYIDPSTRAPVMCKVDKCSVCTDNGTKCTECIPKYGFSSSTSNTCESCSNPDCSICKMRDTCTACTNGYALSNDNVCRVCANNCLSCANSTVNLPGGCLEDGCNAGYAYSHYAKRCYSCPTSCASCYTDKERGLQVCVQCLAGITPITDVSIYGIWCGTLPNKSCAVGTYLDNGQCAPCYGQIYGCGECTTRYTCTECLPGHFLSDNLCVACDDNCVTCSGSATNCTSCDEKLVVKDGKCVLAEEVIPNCEEPADDTGGSTNCKLCKAGFYLDGNANCKECVANCQNCNGPDLIHCSLGFNGYRFDPITNTLQKCNVPNCDLCPDFASSCSTCNLGFYPDLTGSACIKGKISNCKVYASGGATCQHCLPGYGATNDQAQCLPCPVGCKGECSATTCESGICFQGYYYDNEICKPCPSNCAACVMNSYGVVLCTRCTSGTIFSITSVPGLFCGRLNQQGLISPGIVSVIVILVLIIIGLAVATPFLIKRAKRRSIKSEWMIKSSKSAQGSEEHNEFLMEKQGLI